MAKVLFLFCDGIGIGPDDPAVNPFAVARSPYLPFYTGAEGNDLPYGGIIVPTAADMGVAGLPQSATGQTAMLTGIRSSEVVGKHISGFPTPSLRKIIDADSIFLKLQDAGKRATFANALSKEYFERMGEWISATTRAQRAGGFAPRTMDDLRAGRAVSHDLTNSFLARMGHNVPIVTVERSAEILATILREVDFCLFEFILSDAAGHSQDFDEAAGIIAKLETFLAHLLPRIDLDEYTVLLTSDHGNLEDLSVKTHTTNPVPTCIWGHGRSLLRQHIRAIEDVTPAIVAYLLNSPGNV